MSTLKGSLTSSPLLSSVLFSVLIQGTLIHSTPSTLLKKISNHSTLDSKPGCTRWKTVFSDSPQKKAFNNDAPLTEENLQNMLKLQHPFI